MKLTAVRVIVVAAWLILSLTLTVHAQSGFIAQVTPLAESVGQYERFEVRVDSAVAVENPYDPAQIQVEGEFTSPSGEVLTVAGFYYHGFSHENGVPVATNDDSWRVRFTPVETGDYRYVVRVTAGNVSETSAEGTFNVTESDIRGFVRVDERNPRYFAFDNGDPYFPIGLNVAWGTGGGNTINDYTTWLDELAGAGGNFIRVWMAPWDMSIEWIDSGLGDYTRRQVNAYELDQVLELARERGIYIMLTLLNHGPFSVTANPQWDENPFNSANGGMCDVPECFATDPEAIRLWEQRLRYIVARWGYSPNIMAWEWWNEVNWTSISAPEILAPFMERNSALIRELDPYDHLLTHSGSLVEVDGVWSALDFAQDHFYDRDDFVRTFRMAVETWAEAYPDKPFLVGEFGRSTEALSYDREGVELHLGIWGAAMSGAAGTGMSWWWDLYIHPNDLWDRLYVGVSRFFTDEDMGARTWGEPDTEFAERTRARVSGLQATDAALLWVVSRDFSTAGLEQAYLDNLRARVDDPFAIEFADVTGAVLIVNGLDAGAYTVEIWDTVTGDIIETQPTEAVDGAVQITLPAFNRDLAIKIKPA